MLKKITFFSIFLFFVGLIFAEGPEMRGSGMHAPLFPGKWWKNPKVAERVALTQEQIDKLDSIFLKYRKSMIDIQANIQKLSLDLDDLLEQEGVKDEVILKQADSLISARGELQRSYVKMMLEMKKVLSPEQVKKLKELKAETRAKLRKKFEERKREKEESHH